MEKKNSYSKEDLIDCGNGNLFGAGNAQLPIDRMLMIDRITMIDDNSGKYGRGLIVAEMDINPDLWFFDCHFKGDPVMPGCLGLDAMWQLVGFYLAWVGNLGRGRALGVGKVKFSDQILDSAKKIIYKIHIKKLGGRSTIVGYADGFLCIDDRDDSIYIANDLCVGLLQ